MKTIEIFEKFIQSNEPTFGMKNEDPGWDGDVHGGSGDEIIFCLDFDCQQCVVKKECDDNFSNIPSFSEETFKSIQQEYPEYFV